MLLSGPDLRKLIFNGTSKSRDMDDAVASGKIGFDPGVDDDQIGQTSLDLRLGCRFFTHNREGAEGLMISVAKGMPDIAGLWDMHELQERRGRGMDTWKLNPDEFVLGMTYEIVHMPNNLAGFIEGRSTYARLGLSIHQSAPWIHPGFRGPIFLEIKNSGNYSIELTPLVERPCQLSFFQVSSPLGKSETYGSGKSDGYQDQERPTGR